MARSSLLERMYRSASRSISSRVFFPLIRYHGCPGAVKDTSDVGADALGPEDDVVRADVGRGGVEALGAKGGLADERAQEGHVLQERVHRAITGLTVNVPGAVIAVRGQPNRPPRAMPPCPSSNRIATPL